MTDFAQTLKRARAATGLSQQGMADRMLIPKRTIQDWESGKRIPPPYVQRFVLNELESLNSGEWEEGKIVKPGGLSTCHPTVKCTECGLVFCDIINNHKAVYLFCPHCGAKMAKKA